MEQRAPRPEESRGNPVAAAVSRCEIEFGQPPRTDKWPATFGAVDEPAEVVSQTEAPGAPGHFVLRLRAPGQAARARPGQFAELQVRASDQPLLRRPFSYFAIDAEAGTVDFLYRVVGVGTAIMSALAPGSRVALLGPLGSAFPVPPAADPRPAVLIAGGVGAGPFPPLIAALRATGRPVTAYLGARSSDWLVGRAEMESAGARVVVATDDGSAGQPGLVTEVFLRDLETGTLAPPASVGGTVRVGDASRWGNAPPIVYACGPTPMLARVQAICRQRRLLGYLSLEAAMACGVGACLGCVVERAEAAGYPYYFRVCVEGPVFDAREVRLS